jgi:hypothetical protein
MPEADIPAAAAASAPLAEGGAEVAGDPAEGTIETAKEK